MNSISILITHLVIIAINTFIIMIIWNDILVKKIKGLDLQKLNFWEALAIGVFFSLISETAVIIQKVDSFKK